MCQGLPCVGAEVELLREIDVQGVTVPAGSRGVVRADFPDQREVLVFFYDFHISGRVQERDLGALMSTT